MTVADAITFSLITVGAFFSVATGLGIKEMFWGNRRCSCGQAANGHGEGEE